MIWHRHVWKRLGRLEMERASILEYEEWECVRCHKIRIFSILDRPQRRAP